MKFNKINPNVVAKYLSKYGLKTTNPAGQKYSLQENAQRLQKLFCDGKYELLVCDICDLSSDSELDECPFCGDEDEVKQHQVVIQFKEKELNKNIEIIKTSSQLAAKEIYKIGLALSKIKDERLWKLRLNSSQRPRYSGFYEMVDAEIGIKSTWAQTVMKVSQNFTALQMEEYGVKRLSFAMQVTDGKRQDFLDKTTQRGKGSEPAMKNLITELNGAKSNADKTSVPPPAPPTPPTVSHPKEIQTTIKFETIKVPLLKRPTAKMTQSGETRPEVNVKDDPWFRLPISNDVVLHVRLFQNEDGDLSAMVETRRGKHDG